jgi:hypothetical protein
VVRAKSARWALAACFATAGCLRPAPAGPGRADVPPSRDATEPAEHKECEARGAQEAATEAGKSALRFVSDLRFGETFNIAGVCLLVDGHKVSSQRSDANVHFHVSASQDDLAVYPAGPHRLDLYLWLEGTRGVAPYDGYTFEIHSEHHFETIAARSATVTVKSFEKPTADPSKAVPIGERVGVEWAEQGTAQPAAPAAAR